MANSNYSFTFRFMDCFFKIKQQYQHKKVLILGLGLQGGGMAALDFFAKVGCQIKVSDLKTRTQLQSSLSILKKNYPKIEYEFGEHSVEYLRWADVIVRNPGVNLNSPALKLAKQQHKEIILASAFFVKKCPVKTIGITGTRGKSTTTNLIFESLKEYYHSCVHLAGNLPEHSAFRLINKVRTDDVVVMELSSWELQGFADLKIAPSIAVLTNIYPDHLNYYQSMDEYINDKMQIISNQKKTDLFITLQTTYQQYQKQIDKNCRSKLILVPNNYYQQKPKYLIGQHNLENASLALKVGEIMGITHNQLYQAMQNFRGLKYRLENLGTIKKALFFNDSTSTTPIAGIKAIETISSTFPNHKITLVCGGKEKNLPYSEWVQTVNQYCQEIFLLPGSFSDLVASDIKQSLVKVANLEALFSQLIPKLNQDQIVLFSPGATSFASFNNEFDRGQQFSQQFKVNQGRYGA